MKLIKKVIGIDISKDTFTTCLGSLDIECQQKVSKAFTFFNNQKGFEKFLKTSQKFIDQDNTVSTWFIMEATGIYYENLAYFLKEKNYLLTVVLPNKIKYFSKTLENKSKTDELDAGVITQYGLTKPLKTWNAPFKIMKQLKELTREYHSLVKTTTQIKNKLEAKKHSYQPLSDTIKRLKAQLSLYKKQIGQVKKQIDDLIKSDANLNEKVNKLKTIKGVALITAATVICETNGFALIENHRQLASYAGLDVEHDQSGKRTGKTKISKKGNSFLRKAVYFPAMCAIRHNGTLKSFYQRLCIKKGYKKIALIAVARKLLTLIYTLWKNNQDFIPNYKTILSQ